MKDGTKIALVFGGGFALGFTMLGIGAYNAGSIGEEPVSMVTVTATPAPIVTTPEAVTTTVIDVPDSCMKAIQYADDIANSVSDVAKTEGKQKEIASFARLSMTGSDYMSLGKVIKMQDDLQDSINGAYMDLATDQHQLEIQRDKCKEETS